MIADYRRQGDVTTFFTDKEGGVSQGNYASFNLGFFSGDDRKCVERNRMLLAQALRLPSENIVVPNEVHGNLVKVVDQDLLSTPLPERDELLKCDALVTDCRDVCLCVTVADCVPVLLYDASSGVIAAAHAGWKGIVACVLRETVKRMEDISRGTSASFYAEIWPSISAPCFEVGEEVVDRFRMAFPSDEISRIVLRDGYPKPHINLREAVRSQLLSLGLPSDHIWSHAGCTFSDQRFYSARRDGFSCGRMVAGILKN